MDLALWVRLWVRRRLACIYSWVREQLAHDCLFFQASRLRSQEPPALPGTGCVITEYADGGKDFGMDTRRLKVFV